MVNGAQQHQEVESQNARGAEVLGRVAQKLMGRVFKNSEGRRDQAGEQANHGGDQAGDPVPALYRMVLFQFILLPLPSSLRKLTSRRSPNHHLVHALLSVANPPDLLRLRTPEPHVSPPLGAVPALLPVLVPQDDPLPPAEALAVEPVLVVHEVALDALEVAHDAVPVTLLGFLRRLLEPAVLVRVLSRLQADALILERVEDVVGPVGPARGLALPWRGP
ncbi:hypothetical protein AU210_015929 [Fusarium oxysporum f. sp. radicis-cucumerinum]|uniref:Uncharacterized protein n=1 Tax=Fusarium oxysporum f. sp. radicis-cucumerinum TaxID=327505 RepID=A0A2H3FVP4_FUSOX|nr:hypothetical protein AU210_015929 [Fusarium oxysporum f. sp. radicis-cucumerinum]